MAKPSKLSINVKAILKEHLNPHGEKLFLNCAVWPNRDGPGKFGDTHYITQEVSKEAREKGIKGAIIGNLTLVESEEYHHGTDRVTRPPARRPAHEEHEQNRPQQRSNADRLRNPQPTGSGEPDDGRDLPF